MSRTSLAVTLVLAASVLAGCGGMTRAVAVLPNTTDDLAQKSADFRKPATDPARRQP
ncbi:hypothetical protein [Aureimonas sp. Leaf454]|uniref:hypothetical protein n=1 Tax=Aureimonas sp. Leaf454 TaxID=1736381 RepID=UPI0012E36D40|nr:hypothetical protein [Aureimonas sp. Leaf454]